VRIDLHKVSELTADEQTALRTLALAVYPPNISASWPGQLVEWASAQWCIVCWGEDGQALSHVGVVLREGRANECAVKIGGVGGVKTHPDARRRGLASQAIRRALEFFKEQEADFALLVCAPELIPTYEGFGWRAYAGELLVTQRGEKSKFTFNLPMTHPIGTSNPSVGVIDLMGPPW
jgi:aminoglycoside 2'-N-acetyltransferase I